MPKFKPKFIQLPLSKMAGAPWNILDQRGLRIAWCGTDGNHEKDGEQIANDLLNLIAIGEAFDELRPTCLSRSEVTAIKSLLDVFSIQKNEHLAQMYRDGGFEGINAKITDALSTSADAQGGE